MRALRLISFSKKSEPRRVGQRYPATHIGLHADSEVVDLSQHTGITDMVTFLTRPDFKDVANTALESKKYRLGLQDVKLHAPIYNPEKILCVGLNYRDHAIESGMAIPTEPVLFSKLNSTIIGPGETVVKPPETSQLDYEVELVVVIGKEGSRIPKEKAFDYVAGYTVGNDVSARDWQLGKPGGQWLLGKSFDTFCPIGPAIVTHVPDVHNLKIQCKINNEVVQDSNTNQLIFKVDELIEYISRVCTLRPGDLIFTGTPPGVGLGRKPPRYLNPGEIVRCSIEGIGELENTIGTK